LRSGRKSYMKNPLGRHRALVGALVAAGALAAAPAALATPGGPFTWTGGGSSTNWSTAGNWSGTPPADTDVGVFNLGAPCTSFCPSEVDLSGITAQGLTLGNSGYVLDPSLGDNLTLAQPSSGNALDVVPGGSALESSTIEAPLDLNGNQTWSIAGEGNFSDTVGGLTLDDQVSGADNLSIGLSFDAQLGFGVGGGTPTFSVGSLTITGADASQTGFDAANNGEISLDEDLSDPVTLQNVVLGVDSSETTGPLTLDGSLETLALGTGLTSNGVVSMDAANASDITLGTSAGDTPALSATGNVTVGGELSLQEPDTFDQATETEVCTTVTPGATQTLIESTGGTVTGSFVDDNGQAIPDGGDITDREFCADSAGAAESEHDYGYRINYTSQAVTATPLANSTTTLSAPNPQTVRTNQTEALTATVTSESGTPAGTVAFFDEEDGPISGCDAVPVTDSTATCLTPDLSAVVNEHDIAAVYTPTDTTNDLGSSDFGTFFVNTDPTATTLSVDHATPTPGQTVTYTATVTPADAGAFVPGGEVAFVEGAQQIHCANSGDGEGALSGTGVATCQTTYASGGPHAVSALYGGDGNFVGSTSSLTTVSVAGPAAAPAAPAAPGTGVSKVANPVAKPGSDKVSVPITCAAGGPSCTVTTTITVVETLHKHGKIVHRTVVIGTEKTTVAAGTSKSAQVALSAAGRKLLAAHKSLKTTVTVTTGSGKSAKTLAAKKVSLTAAKGHGKKK
jgi:hypothetical protein